MISSLPKWAFFTASHMYKSPYSPVPVTSAPMMSSNEPCQRKTNFLDLLHPLIWWKSHYNLVKIRIYICKSSLLSLLTPTLWHHSLPSPSVRVYRNLLCPFVPFPEFWAPSITHKSKITPKIPLFWPSNTTTPKSTTDNYYIYIFYMKLPLICDFSINSESWNNENWKS